MGNLCKCEKRQQSLASSSSTNELENEVNQAITQSSVDNMLNFYDVCLASTSRTCGLASMFFKQTKLSFIDKLVLDTLQVIKQVRRILELKDLF